MLPTGRGHHMATKSLLKDIDIRDRDTAKSLINALERAEKKKKNTVAISKTYRDATNKDLIRSIVKRAK